MISVYHGGGGGGEQAITVAGWINTTVIQITPIKQAKPSQVEKTYDASDEILNLDGHLPILFQGKTNEFNGSVHLLNRCGRTWVVATPPGSLD